MIHKIKQMDGIYLPSEIPLKVLLSPRDLGPTLFQKLEESAKKLLSGKCMPRYGYIKPGSVNIVRKSAGFCPPGKFTGMVSYELRCSCMAGQPVRGLRTTCMVIGKNESGLVAKDYTGPFVYYVPRIETDINLVVLDRVQVNDYIEVEIVKSRLQPPNSERPNAEYWIVCKLAAANMGDLRVKILPKIVDITFADLMTLMSTPIVMAASEEYERSILTNGYYDKLEKAKNTLENINIDYIVALNKNPNSDPILNATFRNDIGQVIHTNPDNTAVIRIIKTKGRGSGGEVTVKLNSGIYEGMLVAIIPGRNGYIRNYDFWQNHARQVNNDYELIFPPNSYITQVSCEPIKAILKDNAFEKKYAPDETKVIDRAYYKIKEILIDPKFVGRLIPIKHKMHILCVAESPGAFIQAIIRQRQLVPKSNDYITAMSLPINEGDTWSKLREHYAGNPHVSIDKRDTSGDGAGGVSLNFIPDAAGDLTVRKNLEALRDSMPQRADLITGDGGITRDKTENMEELDSHILIFSEICCALMNQETGGNFILKIFDVATELTANFIAILNLFYEEINMIKPVTSRHANSEKYLVCLNFQVPNSAREQLVELFLTILDSWKRFKHLFPMSGPVFADFSAALTVYNAKFMSRQTQFIEAGLSYSAEYIRNMVTDNPDAIVKKFAEVKVLGQIKARDSLLSTLLA